MNILFLLHSYPKIGGIEVVTETVSGYLRKNHKLFYLARIYDDSVMKMPRGCFYFKSKDVTESIAFLNKVIDENGIDVIINQGPFLPYQPLLDSVKNRGDVKLFSFLHFSPGFEFQMIKYKWMTEKNRLKRAYKRVKTKLRLNTLQYNPGKIKNRYKRLAGASSYVVVLSKGYINTFKENYDIHNHTNIISIPNPSRYEADENISFDEKKRVVLFVGRLELESKRIDRLLDIWKNIEKREGWVLKIVGDGPCRKDLEKKMAAENIDNVIFAGQQSDIVSLYKEASVIALTSSYEGQPLCFLEGVQFGAIPMAFDVSIGIREIVEPISDNLLIPSFNLDGYCSELEKIINDNNYRRDLLEKTLIQSKNYSLERVGKMWDKLLEDKL